MCVVFVSKASEEPRYTEESISPLKVDALQQYPLMQLGSCMCLCSANFSPIDQQLLFVVRLLRCYVLGLTFKLLSFFLEVCVTREETEIFTNLHSPQQQAVRALHRFPSGLQRGRGPGVNEVFVEVLGSVALFDPTPPWLFCTGRFTACV